MVPPLGASYKRRVKSGGARLDRSHFVNDELAKGGAKSKLVVGPPLADVGIGKLIPEVGNVPRPQAIVQEAVSVLMKPILVTSKHASE